MIGEGRRRTDESTSDAALRIFGTHTVLTLATVYRNEPLATSLMYASEGFILYWLSDPRSRHSRSLSESHRASVTVAGHFTDFRTIEGLQCRGSARKVDNKAAGKHAFQLLADRYEFLREFLSGPAKLVRSLDLAAVYRFDPDEVILVDNAKGFGHKEAVPLRPGD